MAKAVSNKLYFSLRPLKKYGRTFNFIFGGRGTGKTFNSIKEEYEDGDHFIYMRRTQNEVDLLASDAVDASLNPFKSLNVKLGTTLDMYRINKNIFGITDDLKESKRNIGYVLGLSTVANIRGFDASDISDLLFDEFIPQKNVRLFKDEGGAFLNAYETINRNREFDGSPPVRCYLMTNSNTISHPLLEDLGLMRILERMERKGQNFIDLPEKDCTITRIKNREFEEKKKKTALYRLTQGTKFYDMAINNEFAYDDFSQVSSRSLKEYRPICSIGKICIYKHKSRCEYYASAHMIKCNSYTESDQDIRRFYIDIGRELYGAYVNNQLVFESYGIKQKLVEIIT